MSLSLSFKNFCSSTSLHCLAYLYNSKGWVWKTFWLIVLLVTMTFCLYFIIANYLDFVSSTVVTTIDSTDIPLDEVYFPAITICSNNQVNLTLLLLAHEEKVKYLLMLTSCTIGHLKDLSVICTVS